MAYTLAAFSEALQLIFADFNFLYIILGALLGVVFGVIPGLSAPILLSLLIPLTISMRFDSALLLLGAALGGTTFSGAITSILFGVPGTANNIATTLDGFPLAKQGRATEAITAAATASVFGTIFGNFILLLLIPGLSKIVVAFGPPEIFWITMLGIFLISIAARESMFKGLLSGGIGLLLSTHGYSTATGLLRFTFGVAYLWNGFGVLTVTLGLFGIAEVINLILGRNKIADSAVDLPIKGSIASGFLFTAKNFPTVIRCGIIGMVVGIIPGAGAGIADTVAYVSAKKSSRNPESFGNGNMIGVIAPESSNNAKDAGAMVPLLAFGIPGSLATAIILGAFILHGIQPGPKMLTEYLPSSMVLVLAVFFSGILSSVFGVAGLPIWKAVTKIPASYLFVFVIGVSTLGVYGTNSNAKDVLVVFLFGILGYVMIRYSFNRVALILGLVLGPVAESSFLRALQISEGNYAVFFRSSICIALVVLMVGYAFWPAIKARMRPGREAK
ncbi:MAG: tripartite tricarboxylate transporter permease [Clostridiales Family XIII bacterium]|jgi:putative tricarboxylic transport membrane protein|nr:tripartite tricarboxylate transporter permease [Clostridiales Family XIII bacterium]